MTYLKTTTIVAAAAVALFATDAYADGYKSDDTDMKQSWSQAESQDRAQEGEPLSERTNVQTIPAPLPEAEITKIRVKAPLNSDRFIPVEARDGTTYYNRFIAPEALEFEAVDVTVTDRYFIRHDGKRYLNRIIKPET